MTPKIDETKLRKYFADAKAAHAALMAAWDETRTARRELNDAELALSRETAGAQSAQTRKRPESASTAVDAVTKAEAAVADARNKLARCEAERERRNDAWEHASRLKRTTGEYARAHGALPADLIEELN